jgi:Metallopeptidase family M81
MRIAIGGISHETSTFAPTPTTLRDFETGLGLFRSNDIVARFRGANNCTSGFIATASCRADRAATASRPRPPCNTPVPTWWDTRKLILGRYSTILQGHK